MPDMEELTAEIRSHYRSYVFAMDTRKSMDLRLGAFLRVQLGWSKDQTNGWFYYQEPQDQLYRREDFQAEKCRQGGSDGDIS